MELMRAISDAPRRCMSDRRVTKWFTKKRNIIALSVFVAVAARAFWNMRREGQMVSAMLQAYDMDQNQRMSLGELQGLLSKNGVELESKQIKAIFGLVDDEDDGYDLEELSQVVSVVSDLPSVSANMHGLGHAKGSAVWDLSFAIITGIALYWLVDESEYLHSKWAATSLKHAVRNKMLQREVSHLQDEASKVKEEKKNLEKEIEELSALSPSHSNEGELKKLRAQLSKVQFQEIQVRSKMEKEVADFKSQAQKSMAEAERNFKKMERIASCIKGLDAFEGVAAEDSALASQGAQRGFAQRAGVGWSAGGWTFGTMQDGKLDMYETSRKLGEGRNCAYLCSDISTGHEYALKMYRVNNPSDRKSAIKDICALQSQVGKHPRIMDYDRVIESAEQVFVLMEYIRGKDLFDWVMDSAAGIPENVAKPLFKDLAEAVQHLHKHEVIHCDLKPENAMVEGDIKSGEARLKLIDFGCSCFMKYEDKEGLDVPFDPYTPPEHSHRLGNAKPATSSDMWRLGCTLFITLLKASPFSGDVGTAQGDKARQSDQFFKTVTFKKLSAEAQDLISKLIVGDPQKRLSADEVLEHPWLQIS